MYDAFISYSWKADGKLSPAIQKGLKHFAKPLFKFQALSIYIDKTDLSSSPHLWSSIRDALEESRYFVLMASPDSVKSKWVQREIQYWMQHHDYRNLIIVLTDGDIVWDEDTQAFDWDKTTAISKFLGAFYEQEPLFVDMREVKQADDYDMENPSFKMKIAQIAATIRRTPIDNLVGSELSTHKKLIALRNTAIAALAILLVLAGAFAHQAQQSSAEAKDYFSRAVFLSQRLESELNKKRSINDSLQRANDSLNALHVLLDTATAQIDDYKLQEFIRHFRPSGKIYYKMPMRFSLNGPTELQPNDLQITPTNASMTNNGNGNYIITPTNTHTLSLLFSYKDSAIAVPYRYQVNDFPPMNVVVMGEGGPYLQKSRLLRATRIDLKGAVEESLQNRFVIQSFKVELKINRVWRTFISTSANFTQDMLQAFRHMEQDQKLRIRDVKYRKPNGTSGTTNFDFTVWMPGAR